MRRPSSQPPAAKAEDLIGDLAHTQFLIIFRSFSIF
jgi:hypothetical protein